MRLARVLPLVALLGAVPLAVSQAQTGRDLRDQGLRAYRALEMERAADLFRRAIATHDLSDMDERAAHAYLGAAEFYRNRSDSSQAAFRRLVLLEPRYRLDSLEFPPEVTRAFDAVRARTLAVAVEVPNQVTFEPGRGGLSVRVYASTPHVVRVRVETSAGDVLRTLHEGRVTDTHVVAWDGEGARGARLGSGLYVLSFASVDDGGVSRRIVDLPVRLDRSAVGEQSLPPRPALLPERNPAGPALLRLGLGLGLATLGWIVTPAFTDDIGPRVAVTLVFTAAGVIGFWEKSPGKPQPGNVAANERRLAQWRADETRVEAANQARRPGDRITLETGRSSVRR